MTTDIRFERTTTPKQLPADTNYGFGRHFSDHMFTVDYTKAKGWQNPVVSPYRALAIEPGASVLHYGQAIFEGLKAFRGVDNKVRLFRPEMNWKRMKVSADRLAMEFVDLDLFIDSITRLIQADMNFVPTADGTALYLRPALIGTESFLGVRPSESFCFFVVASPVGSYYGGSAVEPVKIWVETKYSRAAHGGIGAAKAGGNYASSLLAAVEAKKRGYPQVLWLDSARDYRDKTYIEEVGTMNVFFKLGDKVVTPELSGTILGGITRDSVIELLRAKHITVEERPVSLEEIIEAQKTGELHEVFGTGTAASISPVGAFGMENEVLVINEGRTGELSSQLYKTLTDIQYGRVPDEMGWTLEVPELK